MENAAAAYRSQDLCCGYICKTLPAYSGKGISHDSGWAATDAPDQNQPINYVASHISI